ncbi:regulating synaptic membrane exocytosis protein 3-like [Saccoglossus kowalevskii]|uniref:Regulating synaptic membrane exocytosis protein 1-like n=1 Tax=Saccoglossus kowalevskii TaxID=10224 RepID=A0ABM0GWN1_SACKO|nr:PREDICTED: regulating synaptic membrane exocytosis protein 1-like [Saccoglossus kowalevskii]
MGNMVSEENPFGPGQIVEGRQREAENKLGEIQLSFSRRKGQLIIEVVRARGLTPKPGRITPAAPYVKLYLMWGRVCIGKKKTRTVEPSFVPVFQEQFAFSWEYTGKILQVKVWGNYDMLLDRKNFIGMVQIRLEQLSVPQSGEELNGWYKLLPVP